MAKLLQEFTASKSDELALADDRRETTWGELGERVDRLINGLTAAGVAPGDTVAMMMGNRVEAFELFWAAAHMGITYVPVNWHWVADELAYVIEDSGATALVVGDRFADVAAEALADPRAEQVALALVAGGSTHPALTDYEGFLAGADPEPSELAAMGGPMFYTSGTTGHPKGVLHAHRAMIGRTPARTHWFDFKDGDRIMHSGKFNWTYVLGSALMDPLYNGKTVIVHEGPNDATLWPRLIAKHQCTVFIGVPTIYRQIIQKTEFAAADVPSLRHCMSAGEHLSDEMLAAWRQRFGMDVYEAIGMSEISYYISHNIYHPIRPGSAGFRQPGHDVRLLDRDLKEVSQGEEGMICIPDYDPGLFIEYWNLPEETAKVHHDGWFLTGDYARKDEDGYIWFLGRRDDIINTFGYRVSPHEVERVMKTHPDVADCVAIGQDIGSEKTLVSICLILRPEAASSEEDLIQYGSQHLADYKRPKTIHIVNDYPRTKNGKVLRNRLQQQIEAVG